MGRSVRGRPIDVEQRRSRWCAVLVGLVGTWALTGADAWSADAASAPNHVGELVTADPNRREFMTWLSELTLSMPDERKQQLLGQPLHAHGAVRHAGFDDMMHTPVTRCLSNMLRCTAVFAAAAVLVPPVQAHTLSIMRVTPGKLSAGDTATIAAKFDFDAKACAVQLDFGDGSEPVTTTIPATAAGADVPFSMQHVYAQSGAYMVSIVPATDKGTPKCDGGKHSTLIDVLEAAPK